MRLLAPVRTTGRSDEISLEERFGLIEVLRVGLVAAVLVAAWLVPSEVGATPAHLALPSALLVAVIVPVGIANRRGRSAGMVAQRAALIADSAYLVVITAASGGPRSGLVVLFYIHLVAVATLASGRAAVQVALWDVAGLTVVTTTSLGHRVASSLGAVAAPRAPAGATALAGAGFLAIALLTSGLTRINERELRRSRAELQALAAMGAELEQLTDPVDVGVKLLATTAETFGAARGALVVPDGTNLVVAVGAPPEPHPGADGESDGTGDALLTAARAAGGPLARRHLDATADRLASSLLPGARDIVAAPLGAGPRAPVLLLELGSRRPGEVVARRTLLAVAEFASHGAVALASTALLADRERLAAVDSLTGLANRRALDSSLVRAVAAASRRAEPLSVVLVDIDYFKAVNDSRGHAAGDQVLQAVAGVLARACRAQDLVARFGGEEFVMVLPGCPLEAAAAIAERARRDMANDTGLTGVTVSAGVATMPEHGSDGDELLKAADIALYASKAGGRDRVTLAGGGGDALS